MNGLAQCGMNNPDGWGRPRIYYFYLLYYCLWMTSRNVAWMPLMVEVVPGFGVQSCSTEQTSDWCDVHKSSSQCFHFSNSSETFLGYFDPVNSTFDDDNNNTQILGRPLRCIGSNKIAASNSRLPCKHWKTLLLVTIQVRLANIMFEKPQTPDTSGHIHIYAISRLGTLVALRRCGAVFCRAGTSKIIQGQLLFIFFRWHR